MDSPRIIIGIMMHDTGRQFGCFGAEGVESPNIDRMAAEGVRFENHFSTGTVCVPSRASILTGRYFHNARLCRYDENQPSLPRSLRDAGYQCWRLGFAEEGEYASPAGAPLPYATRDESGTRLLGYDRSWTETADAQKVAEKLIAILSENTAEKIYICASFREAHSPYDSEVTPEEIDRARPPKNLPQLPDTFETKQLIAQFNRLLSAGDKAVGTILDYLRENGLEETSLVWFGADHGVDLPRAKQTCYDQGTATPFILWGGALPCHGVVASGLSSHLDIGPTVCELANARPPMGGVGVSQVAQLRGLESPRSYCISEQSRESPGLPTRSIRTDRYRYIRNFTPGWPVPMAHTLVKRSDPEVFTKAYSAPRPAEELYDIVSDPAQQNNLAYLPEYREVKRELMATMYAELARTNDSIFYPDSEYSGRDPGLAFWRRDGDGNFRVSKEK